MTTATVTPTAEALAAYRRCVERLASGRDVDLTATVAVCHAAGRTTTDLADDVVALARGHADGCPRGE